MFCIIYNSANGRHMSNLHISFSLFFIVFARLVKKSLYSRRTNTILNTVSRIRRLMAVNPIPYSRRDPIMPAGSRDYKIPNPESRDGENRYGIAIPSYSSISVAFRDIDKEVKITWNRLTKYFWRERDTSNAL